MRFENLFFSTSLLLLRVKGDQSFDEYPICDVSFESTVCLLNESHVLLPDAKPYGLIGKYTFDESRPLDSSGERNHALGRVFPGPPYGSGGASALFRKNYLTVAHTRHFESSDFAVTFWVHRLEDKSSAAARALEKNPLENWCPIVYKGIQDKERLDASPGILIDPQSGHLKIVLSTTATDATQGEFLISNFKIKNKRWIHVAIVRHLSRIRLYLNGILDSTLKTSGMTKSNSEPFYIGGTPWSVSICDTPILLDELKIYAFPIGRDQIEAEASSASFGFAPSEIFLGCLDCTKIQAQESCPEKFHLCTHTELLIGGYGVLQQLGVWSSEVTDQVFTSDLVELNPPSDSSPNSGGPDVSLTGIGLCCRDSI